MRDFSLDEYCDSLWIHDLLSLRKDDAAKEFNVKLIRVRNDEDNVEVANTSLASVVVFGTVVGIQDLGERGTLYSIDDGTGIIACRYNRTVFNDLLDTIVAAQNEIMSDAHLTGESQVNCSTASADDTIFNDLSMQEEETKAMERGRLQTLYSIYSKIQESMSCIVQEVKLGDSILVQGKLYSYFNVNQVYINTIRHVDLREEMLLTSVKLEQGVRVSHDDHFNDESMQEIQLIENTRKSGILTFDNVHHSEVRDMPASKLIVGKETCDCTLNETWKRHKPSSSSVPDEGSRSITFDTLTDLNE